MKQIAFKSALMRTVAVMLLTLGTVSVSAQYYMNIRTSDGTNVQYVVTDIDSVWFTGSAVPTYEYVDLGLSVNWATFNVGATKPEEYGDYFAWGETEPKSDYSWSNYKWCDGSYSKLTKYNTSSSYGKVDGKTTLDLEDDVAQIKWGGNWRMPIKEEQEELYNHCTWTWFSSDNTEFNGIAGYKVTSNVSGYTDRFIFLPATGCRYESDLYSDGSAGCYWSADFQSFNAYYLIFSSSFVGTSHSNRNYGFSVRPVCPSERYLKTVAMIELSQSEIELTVGDEPFHLQVTTSNRNGDVINADVQWTSSDENVAVVSNDGSINAVGSGSCIIKALSGDVESLCLVLVTDDGDYLNGIVSGGITVSVNDYFNGIKRETARPRVIKDPSDPGNSCIVVTTNQGYSNNYDSQLFIQMNDGIQSGDTIRLSMRYKADQPQSSSTEAHKSPQNYFSGSPIQSIYFSTEWDVYELEIVVYDPIRTYVFDLSYLKEGNNCYFDDINVQVSKGKSGDPEYAEATIDGTTYILYKKDIDRNDIRTNPEGQQFYRAGLMLDVHKEGSVSTYQICDNIYIREDGSAYSCLVFDVNQRKLIVYGHSKSPNTYYDMDGFAYISSLDEISFSVETVFNYSTCCGWYSYFAAAENYYSLIHFNYSGNYQMESRRNADGTWTTISQGSTTPLESSTSRYKNGRVLIFGNHHPQPTHEYVDLGLSVNWATFNVGAENPWDFGDYYAWGETETKPIFSWTNYKFHAGGDSYNNVSFSKYNTDSSRGTVDNKTTLDPDDDVAHVKWGGNWRMYTKAEQDELIDNCTWIWYDKGNTEFNGVAGYKVTSNVPGYTDRFIFLPTTGYINFTYLNWHGTNGYSWSSSLITDDVRYAWGLGFESRGKGWIYGDRKSGRTVRPVCPSEEWLNTVSITLNSSSESIELGKTYTLTAAVKHGDEIIDREVTWVSSDPSIASVGETGVVTGKAAGSATITATCLGKTATCTITVTEQQNGNESGYEYVDLGLSVKWATFNVGATKPEEYGDYYAWGETEPYYEAGYAYDNPQTHWKSDKSVGYSWTDYRFRTDGDTWDNVKFNKYNTDSNKGTVDNKTTLDPEDDVAHVLWKGNWRMPTNEELVELRSKCTWKWTTQNGVDGYLVTSNKTGFTNRSIFLPATGWYLKTNINMVGSYGCYWSSSLDTDKSYNVRGLFFSSGFCSTSGDYRCYGFQVRPVCPSETYYKVSSIELNNMSVGVHVNGSIQINATSKNGYGDIITTHIQWSSSDENIAIVSDDGTITAKSEGTCNVIASVGSVQSTCKVRVNALRENGNDNGYGYVDLGLSVNWATFNIGADKLEGYGDYFAWGETQPYYESGYAYDNPQTHWKSDKSGGYTWTNYRFRTDGDTWDNVKFNKYNSDGNRGIVDNKTTLDLEDDAAHVMWNGGWRLPTAAEQSELLDNCTWTWITLNGVKGFMITSNVEGFTDRSIFLPAAGFRCDEELINYGDYGYYWSSSLHSESPYSALNNVFASRNVTADTYYRYVGFSLRPVRPSETFDNSVSVIELNQSEVDLLVGESIQIKTTARNNAGTIFAANIQWSSSDETVARVSNDGSVISVGEGTCTLTASAGSVYSTCKLVSRAVCENGSENGYGYVDLGLSVKWATYNVGSNKPEECGDYYAWGEIETKDTYNWSTYKWCNGSNTTLTKYNSSNGSGAVDNKVILDLEDDVAHVKWGGSWRIPTQEEIVELLDNSTCAETTLNGVKGYKITSKKTGYTDRSIFLPYAGYHLETSINGINSFGEYWSSSQNNVRSQAAWFLVFQTYRFDLLGSARCYGLSIRPVCQ